MIWLGDRFGNVKKVLQQGSELQYHDNFVLLAPQDLSTYVSWALNFESPWFIECTASKVGDKIQPVSVRFLRYGLELTASASTGYTWHLKDRRNWALVPQSENVWLPHFNSYLVFEENAISSDPSVSSDTPKDSLFMLPYLKKCMLISI